MVARLSHGLGRMVRTVKSYGGELDSLDQAIAVLPACWVAFGGSRINAKDTAKKRYEHEGEFVVMAATRSLRSETAQRQGGADIREVGSNTLIRAVLRLMSSQTLNQRLHLGGLSPKAVRTLYNHAAIGNAAVSVYAIEFKAVWYSSPLADGRYPEKTDDSSHPDYIFTQYQGELSEPWPWFERFDSLIFDPQSGAQLEHRLHLAKDKP